MIPQDFIEKHGLILTDKVLGDSFMYNEPICKWPNDDKLFDGTLYVGGCDHAGRPLDSAILLVYQQEGKPTVNLQVTSEFMADMPFHAMASIIKGKQGEFITTHFGNQSA